MSRQQQKVKHKTTSIGVSWQDFLIKKYGDKQYTDTISTVLMVLLQAISEHKIDDDPVLHYSRLAFREVLDKNGFTKSLGIEKAHKVEKVLPVTEINENNDDEFDLSQFLANVDAGEIKMLEVPRGYSDNTEMIEEYQENGDRESATYENIFSANQRLIWKVASRYESSISKTCLTVEDLVGYGNEGLIKAIEKFDPQQGYAFSTYATWWIRQSITRNIANDGSMIRLPVHMVQSISKMQRLERKQLTAHGKINSEQICKELRVTEEKYEEYRHVAFQFGNEVSLNQTVSADDTGGTELGDFISNDRYNTMGSVIDPDIDLTNKDVRDHINELLETQLDSRSATILRLRYGFDDGQIHTLEEVGESFGVTRERIRQIEAKALKQLSKIMKYDNRKDYLIEEPSD